MSTGYFLPENGAPLRHAHPHEGKPDNKLWHEASQIHHADTLAHSLNDSWSPEACNWAKTNRSLPNAIKSRLIRDAQAAHDVGAPSPTFTPPTPRTEAPTSTPESLPSDLTQRLDDVEELSQAAATTANAVAEQSDRTEAKLAATLAAVDAFKAEIALLKDTKPRLIRYEFAHTNGDIINLDGTQHRDFDKIFRAVRKMSPRRRNYWLAGPAGSGKSYLVEQIAKVLGLRCDGYGSILNIIQLTGYTGVHGDYFQTVFYDYYINGGVLFLDECDGSIPEAMVALNMALANGKMSFPKGKDGSGGLRERHPDFYCFATANTMGAGADAQYSGRFKQDDAFMDRFLVFPIDYDTTLERMMIEEHAQEWVKVVQQVREANRLANQGKSGFVISPRASEKGQDLLRSTSQDDPPMTNEEVVELVFGRYRKHEKWAHIGRAAEEFARKRNANPLSSIDFTGSR